MKRIGEIWVYPNFLGKARVKFELTKGSTMNSFIRVWKEFDIDDIKKHLLVSALTSCTCENCGKFGLDLATPRTCPDCKTEFKYIALRLNPEEKSQENLMIRKLIQARYELIFINYEDYKKVTASAKAKDIFKLKL